MKRLLSQTIIDFINNNNYVTPEILGRELNSIDDTYYLDLAFSLNVPVKLNNIIYKYFSESHTGKPQKLPVKLYGNKWTIECYGPVQFDMPNNFDWSGGTFFSHDIFPVNKNESRKASHKSIMLISNAASGKIRIVTQGRLHVNFKYLYADSMRGEGFIQIFSSNTCNIDINSEMSGAIICCWLNLGTGAINGFISFENYETGLLSKSGPDFNLKINAVNTPDQQNMYRATNLANSYNGKDAILIESSKRKTYSINLNIYSEYAIERAAYLQNVSNGEIKCQAIGSDGGKTVNGCRNLKIESNVKLPKNINNKGRYSWQCYGGINGPTENIIFNTPRLINQTGLPGNKEVISILGKCNNIKIFDAYGFECGWGLWTVPARGLNGIFTPDITNVTIYRGRLEGKKGRIPSPAIRIFTQGNVTKNYLIKNIEIFGLSSMPNKNGKTMIFNKISGYLKISNYHIDNIDTSIEYLNYFKVDNCKSFIITSSQPLIDYRNQ